MTFSRESQDIILTSLRSKTAGSATEQQIALAFAVTHGENNVEVIHRLIDDVRQS